MDRSLGFTVVGDADTRKAEAKIGAFARSVRRDLERAVRNIPDIEIDADSSQARRRIVEIRRELASLSGKRIGIDVDARQAQARMRELGRELARLATQEPNIQLRADTAAASAQLAGLSRQASRLDGQNIALNVNVNDVMRAIGLVGLLTAGVSALSAVALPAAAALAAIPAAAAGGAQFLGALGAGFAGVGDAVKEMGNAEKSAATTATSAANQQVASMERIASASRAVERAEQQRARTAVQGSQQIDDAKRAEEQATDSLRNAQEDLNQAYAEAIERQQDLNLELRSGALSQREAAIGLREAQRELAEGRAAGATGDELERLEINAERAALRVVEVNERMGDLNEQRARGVAGDEQVVSARERVADAERRVGEAALQTMRAQQQAAWANQDAAAAVVDAQRQLQAALTQTGTAGVAAANKVAFAMAQLSPAGQRFAQFLHSELQPALRGIGHGVQEAMLPDMEASLRNLLTLVPTVSTGLAETGSVIGDLAVKGSAMMASGPWRDDFATIMASNNRSLEDFGSAGLELADAFRSITVASLLLVERFAEFTRSSSDAFNSWIQSARASGELNQFFLQASDTLAELGDILGQVAIAFLQVTEALGPLGMVLLRTVGQIAEFVGNLAEAHPLLVQITAAGLLAASMAIKLGTAMGALGVAVKAAAAGFAVLLPSALMTRFAGVTAAMNTAALSAGVFTERMTGSAAAGQRVADAGSKVTNAAARIGATLPIAGLAVIGLGMAWDGLTINTEEAAEKLLQGGAAADQATASLAKQAVTFEVLNNSIPGLGSALGWLAGNQDDARAKTEQLLAAMTPLERAQALAGQATRDHAAAVERFGPNSVGAQLAFSTLTVKNNELEAAQRRAEWAAMSHTERIREQQNVMLSAVNAEIAYRDSLQMLSDGLAQNGLSFDINTEAGRRNLSNLTNTIGASDRYRQSLIDQGWSEADATRKAIEHRDQLVGVMVQLGMTRDAAQALIDTYYRVPPHIYTRAELDDWLARDRMNRFIADYEGRQIRVVANMVTPQGVPIRQLGGGAQGAVVQPMQAGGMLSSRLAQVVPPDTPRLIGDRMRGNESFIPWDRSPRSLAILAQTAQAMGFRLAPMAAGGVLGMQAGGALRPGGGAAAPVAGGGENPVGALSALGEAAQTLTGTGLAPLAAELTDRTLPALQLLQQQAGVDSKTAVDLLSASLPPLTLATQVAGQLMRDQWALNTGAVQTAGQLMGQAQFAWQTFSNASWANIAAVTGANIGQITGPQFGTLHAGLDFVMAHSANMADAVGFSFGRMRALTADPIRWSIQGPLNAGLRVAWNEIDAFFQLGRQMREIPIGFATGGRVTGGRPGRDSVPSLLTPDEVVWDTRAVRNAGGPDAVDRMRRAFRDGRDPGAYLRPHQRLVTMDDLPMRFLYGGVQPHVAAAGQEIERVFGRMPGGIGGVGSRPGPSDHPSGHALDFMTLRDKPLGDRVAGHLMAHSARMLVKYLIWQQAINQGTGWSGMPDRGSITANHYDHVHASFLRAGQAGRGFAGGMPGFDIQAFLDEKLARTRAMIAEIRARFGNGNTAAAAERMANDAVAGLIAYTHRRIAELGYMGDPGGAGVERWRPMVHQALNITGQPLHYDNITLRRMNQESGGNPNAVNRSDSNWARGTPSVGLMQVIGPTYSRYKHPGFDHPPYMYGTSTHPLSNTLASMRYAVARYGSLPAAYNRAGGYDTGGILRSGYGAWNRTGLPERVLTPRQTDAFDRLVEVLTTRRGAGLPAVAGGDGATQPLIGSLTVQTPRGASAQDVVNAAMHKVRVARHRVHR